VAGNSSRVAAGLRNADVTSTLLKLLCHSEGSRRTSSVPAASVLLEEASLIPVGYANLMVEREVVENSARLLSATVVGVN
jgi:hypothetical protein